MRRGTDRSRRSWSASGSRRTVCRNVQAMEPMIEPGLIRAVATLLADTARSGHGHGLHPIRDADELFNPNVVKSCWTTPDWRAISAGAVPWARDAFGDSTRALPQGSSLLPTHRHLCYRADFLRSYTRLERSPLEEFEALEQLRALWHGYAISVAVRQMRRSPASIRRDLERVRALFDRAGHRR